MRENACKHTGMPELVLIPAPVTTRTFFAFQRASAISCRSSLDSGNTWLVGILKDYYAEASGRVRMSKFWKLGAFIRASRGSIWVEKSATDFEAVAGVKREETEKSNVLVLPGKKTRRVRE